jgi:hypothetical protein
MKEFIRIKESKWLPGSNNKMMIYEDDRGRSFIGPPIQYIQGETIIAEVSEVKPDDGYYHIIKVVGKI